jgi:multidrug resistance efflux pump
MDNRLHRMTLTLVAVTITAAFAWAWYTIIDIPITATGIAKPQSDPAQVMANTTGRIRRIQVHEGAQVHQGDVLLQLDTREFKQKRAALLATLQKAPEAPLYNRLHEIELALNDLTITSPADGCVISLLPLRPGDTLHVGTAIARIIAPANGRIIESWLPETERGGLREGGTVQIQDEEVVDGVITAIQPDRIVITVSKPLLPGARYPIHFRTRHERIAALLFERVSQFFK